MPRYIMATTKTLGGFLSERGLSRRSFLKYCSIIASQLALSPSAIPALAERLEKAERRSAIWFSF